MSEHHTVNDVNLKFISIYHFTITALMSTKTILVCFGSITVSACGKYEVKHKAQLIFSLKLIWVLFTYFTRDIHAQLHMDTN